MGKKIKAGIGKIFSKLFQILGITSILAACGSASGKTVFEIDSPVMYGPYPEYGPPPVPVTDFYSIEGTVKDTSGNPVKGISVSVEMVEDSKGITEGGETVNKAHGTFFYFETDENGKYRLDWSEPENNRDVVRLFVEDVDGEENGSFVDKHERIEIEEFSETEENTEEGSTRKFICKDKDISLEADKYTK